MTRFFKASSKDTTQLQDSVRLSKCSHWDRVQSLFIKFVANSSLTLILKIVRKTCAWLLDTIDHSPCETKKHKINILKIWKQTTFTFNWLLSLVKTYNHKFTSNNSGNEKKVFFLIQMQFTLDFLDVSEGQSSYSLMVCCKLSFEYVLKQNKQIDCRFSLRKQLCGVCGRFFVV